MITKEVIVETVSGSTTTTTVKCYKAYDVWTNRASATYVGYYNEAAITAAH
jgi:hypothetical protein